jgi:hypothetical protein
MLKPKEIAEISLLLWYLPLDKVEEIKKLVLELDKQHGYEQPVDDSNEWTEQDLRDATAASMRRLEEEDAWEENGNT